MDPKKLPFLKDSPYMPQDVSLVIVNFNGRHHLEDCLTSVYESRFRNFEVLMVDNGSRDQSCEYVAREFPRVKILPLDYNSGFSVANNLAVRQAGGDLLAFLNNDVEVETSWLEALVQEAEKDKSSVAFASKMKLFDVRKVLNGVGGAMNRIGYTWDRGMFEPDHGQYDQPEEVFFACAGACLIRKKAYAAAGGMDEDFFMYHEDVDLCWTLWQQGGRIRTVPQAVVYHKFGGTSLHTMGAERREYIGERNNIRSLIKHYELPNLARALASLLRMGQSPGRKWILLRNFAWNIRNLPRSLAERKKVQSTRVARDRELSRLIDPRTRVPLVLPDYPIASAASFLSTKRVVRQVAMEENEIGCLSYGWYPLEMNPSGRGKRVRWTQQEASLFLCGGNAPGRLQLKIYTMGATSGVPAEGTVYLNGIRAGHFSFNRDGWEEFFVEVRHSDLCLEVVIRLEKTWSPDRIFRNGDRRELGVALQKICWESA